MTFSQLAVNYPDVKYEVSNGKKRIARVTVEYSLAGPPEAISKFLDDLDKEWPFSQQWCKTQESRMNVQVEYLVKQEEVERFVRAVPYRGKKITLVS
ncbi:MULTISPECIES: hypothetical protein [Desulfitobacterium]|uniref:Uncharacterized protein n=1 Tax=Desulfitobacterium chlororespirans DSM 11544 TaxID=1121395 RepID=A0A1M7T6J1_9FIRM|nr:MULTISPECIES: hypothetical protein [Desulfitobacterium]SHN66319.1 hypothetical protein SAMN02745215_01654 [Desulfitobacterium chlororespirans DSM 11544]